MNIEAMPNARRITIRGEFFLCAILMIIAAVIMRPSSVPGTNVGILAGSATTVSLPQASEDVIPVYVDHHLLYLKIQKPAPIQPPVRESPIE